MSKFSVTSVLLIDDNDIDNFINRKLLERLAFSENITEVQSGSAALTLLKQMEEKDLPDYIFLDIHMPIMDGFEFLLEFENLSAFVRNKCKVVVVSSSVDPLDYERALSNKYVRNFCVKPLLREQLEALLVST